MTTNALAPLDVSLLPYAEGSGPRVKLAMRIGGEYRLRAIGRRDLERLAGTIGAEPEALVALVREVVEQVPDALADVLAEVRDGGATEPVLARLQAEISVQAASCLRRLEEAADD